MKVFNDNKWETYIPRFQADKEEYKDAMKGFEEWRDVIDGSDELSKQALRNNSDKTKYASLQWNALAEVAKVATHGADKYGNYNYKKGFPLTDLFDSTMRHLIGNPTDSKDGKAHKGFMTGENEDRDSKINHLAHAAWNLLTMLEQELDKETYGNFDDRYKKG